MAWNHDFTIYKEQVKDLSVLNSDPTDSSFQFNLGDGALFGPGHTFTGYETILLQVIANSDGTRNSAVRVPLTSKCSIKFDLTFSGATPINGLNPNALAENKVITANVLQITEAELNIYSYFHVEKDGIVLEDGHGQFLQYIPKEDGNYRVVQRGVNVTTGDYQEKVSNFTLYDGLVTLDSLDYVFYIKKGIWNQFELPQFVIDTLVLASGWYYENGKLIGRNPTLNTTLMPYAKGRVYVKTQVGDIVDY